jgi:membrane fusion protein, heavy metal efflux system
MKKTILAIACGMAILAGCKNKTNEKGHEHGLEPLAYTLYSDKIELFVEFKPLVVGSASKFAAHFTVLGDVFTSLNEGNVTVSLIVGEKGIRNTTDSPSSPGIFRLALTPAIAGAGKLVFDIRTKTFTDQIVIPDVKVYADEKSALAEQADEGSGDDITYLKEQAWKIEFANAPVNRTPFSHVIKTSGQILSAPGDEVIVTSKARGIVLFSGSRAIIGSEVKSGTSLFTIAGGDLAQGNIDAVYKETKANFDKAKADYDRASDLVKDRIISQKDFLQAKTDFENAQTAFSMVAKNYSAGGQGVASPISGFVKNILVSEGQFVEAGTPLATVSKNAKLNLVANVSQKYFNDLPSVSSANFKTAESDEFMSTEEAGGKLISYGKSASAGSPFLTVTFEINNTGNIIPGSIAEVYLKSSHVPEALVIPVSALIEEQGNFFAYVQTGGESFQKRELKLGTTDGISVQVLSGIQEGERVVTKGAYQIKLSQASGTLPAHGHEH